MAIEVSFEEVLHVSRLKTVLRKGSVQTHQYLIKDLLVFSFLSFFGL